MADHWRMALNNYIQKHRLPRAEWGEPVPCGPPNAPTWTVSVFFTGIEYGRGSALQVSAARELAAEHALRQLWNQYGQ